MQTAGRKAKHTFHHIREKQKQKQNPKTQTQTKDETGFE